MKNLFDAALVEALKERIIRLKPDSERLWGKMKVAQMLAHCSASLQLATGDTRPPQLLVGRIIGRLVKPKVLGNDDPLGRNSPTAKTLVIEGERDLGAERQRLLGLIDRFSAGGPADCTTHPHPFFGPLAPQEWSILMYKHLDHHLRQFGA